MPGPSARPCLHGSVSYERCARFDQPTDAAQVNKDGLSHTGNFEFSTTAIPQDSAFFYGGVIFCIACCGRRVTSCRRVRALLASVFRRGGLSSESCVQRPKRSLKSTEFGVDWASSSGSR